LGRSSQVSQVPENGAPWFNDPTSKGLEHKVNNALPEGINSKIQLLKAAARGYSLP